MVDQSLFQKGFEVMLSAADLFLHFSLLRCVVPCACQDGMILIINA